MALSPQQILSQVPQQKPFRFIDEITVVNESAISGTYTYKHDEVFYAGHFPGNPITPGVILLETMCQIGVVSLGIYLLSLEEDKHKLTQKHLILFTDGNIEIFKPVYPGTKVFVQSEKVFWRKLKLRCKMAMYDSHENLLATSIASGLGIKL